MSLPACLYVGLTVWRASDAADACPLAVVVRDVLGEELAQPQRLIVAVGPIKPDERHVRAFPVIGELHDVALQLLAAEWGHQRGLRASRI